MKVPDIPFPQVAQRIKAHWNPYEYNPHQGWFGISRAGKSYTIRHGILPIAGMSRKVIMDVKPGGSRTWNEYGNIVTELKPGFGRGPDGTPHYHMMVSNKSQAERFIDMIGNEGSCIVVIDDSRRITANTPDYALSNHVDQLLTIGAEIGLTVIICANSSTWATSGLRDQCGQYWIGQMGNEIERTKFLRLAGLDKEFMPILNTIRPRHFLYSDRYDGDITIARTHYEGE